MRLQPLYFHFKNKEALLLQELSDRVALALGVEFDKQAAQK
jgi:hypothetical protein